MLLKKSLAFGDELPLFTAGEFRPKPPKEVLAEESPSRPLAILEGMRSLLLFWPFWVRLSRTSRFSPSAASFFLSSSWTRATCITLRKKKLEFAVEMNYLR